MRSEAYILSLNGFQQSNHTNISMCVQSVSVFTWNKTGGWNYFIVMLHLHI